MKISNERAKQLSFENKNIYPRLKAKKQCFAFVGDAWINRVGVFAYETNDPNFVCIKAETCGAHRILAKAFISKDFYNNSILTDDNYNSTKEALNALDYLGVGNADDNEDY